MVFCLATRRRHVLCQVQGSMGKTVPIMGRRALPDDPPAAAHAADLRYVNDAQPGVRRVRAGRGVRYVGVDGTTIRDAATLRRIRALAVPPAWRDVWICPVAHGHLQAVGRDARGRKQYRYHARWRAVRDETKYARLVDFARALPRIRARVAADLARPGLPRPKVLATVVRLLETTAIRVGNAAYVRQNGSYGLTTLRSRHVTVRGAQLCFEFRGKGGKRHCVKVTDRRVAAIVRRCQDLPGQELFQYRDETGQRQTIDSADINEYLRETGGGAFTAKDFRTWVGTVLAARRLAEPEAFPSVAARRRHVRDAIVHVSAQLGNTPTICRRCYVHPLIIEAYLGGRVAPRATRPPAPRGLRPEEATILSILARPVAA
jgi:DNA topoisomerase-1